MDCYLKLTGNCIVCHGRVKPLFYCRVIYKVSFVCRCGDAAVLVQSLLLVLPSLRETDFILRQFWSNVQKVSIQFSPWKRAMFIRRSREGSVCQFRLKRCVSLIGGGGGGFVNKNDSPLIH